jgi:hypothetical protein
MVKHALAVKTSVKMVNQCVIPAMVMVITSLQKETVIT